MAVDDLYQQQILVCLKNFSTLKEVYQKVIMISYQCGK
ncbi:hypothetical protein SALWKB29_0472 [Snodgrassella communis]|uniref:Uncharacterized protein n=1 Tax=Snodgrassella communis TaxID=2946699 RepID=A0A836Z4P4_9NEIS|nr:hypothetical protein SALWKB29_0472 [Snodgrassella communis]